MEASKNKYVMSNFPHVGSNSYKFHILLSVTKNQEPTISLNNYQLLKPVIVPPCLLISGRKGVNLEFVAPMNCIT